jgi:hypothetical protein
MALNTSSMTGKGCAAFVVVGGSPAARRVGWNDFVDLVEVENPPSLARIWVEGSTGCLPAALVAENHRSSRPPTEGMRTDQASAPVVGDQDRPSGTHRRVEAGEGDREDHDVAHELMSL